MTTLSGTKLTDTQLIALSGAAQRQDGAVSLPERIKGMAAQKLATSLMDKGIVREIRAKPGMPAWRRDEDGRTYALVITKLGRAAICVADDGKTRMDAVKEPNPRKCRTFPRERRRSRKNRYAWLPTAVGAQTGNRFTLIEQLVPSGLGPTTHRHRRADEGFYILEGTCAFNADGKTKSGRILTMRRVTAYFFGPPAGELDKAFRNIFIKHGGRPIGAWATHGAR